MKIKAQKFSKLIGKYSVKIQELISNYKLHDYNIKQQIYEDALYCHRNERGIVKVSRWSFNYERKTPMELLKNPLKISAVENKSFYEENDLSKKIIWNLFTTNNKFCIDEKQRLESPLLNSLFQYLKQKNLPEITPLIIEYNTPSPYILENIPYWINVADYFDKKQVSSVIQKERKNNFIEMPLLSCGKGFYTENQISFILESAIASLAGGVKIATANKCSSCIVHVNDDQTFGNNKELLYLVQMLASSFVGVEELIFHNVDRPDFKNALSKYNNLYNGNLFDFLLNQNYCWKNAVVQNQKAYIEIKKQKLK